MGCLFELLALPFKLSIWLIGVILDATGRVLSLLIGMTIAALGVLLSMTLIGAVIGVPMVLFGGGLMLKAIF